MPALQSFCRQAALAVLFDYLFQISAFIVFMAWDEERRESNRADLLCCISFSTKETKPPGEGFWKRVFAEKYSALLQTKICFAFVLLIFGGLFALTVLGIINIPVGLNEQVSMETESNLFNYFTYEKKFIEIGPPAYIVL